MISEVLTIMKSALKSLTITVSVASFFSVSFPQAAKAVSCQAGTALNHSNGSLSSCVLGGITDISVGNNRFACSRNKTISFDEKGGFKSCYLAVPAQIRKGNDVVKCPPNAMIAVWFSSDHQEISCNSY